MSNPLGECICGIFSIVHRTVEAICNKTCWVFKEDAPGTCCPPGSGGAWSSRCPRRSSAWTRRKRRRRRKRRWVRAAAAAAASACWRRLPSSPAQSDPPRSAARRMQSAGRGPVPGGPGGPDSLGCCEGRGEVRCGRSLVLLLLLLLFAVKSLFTAGRRLSGQFSTEKQVLLHVGQWIFLAFNPVVLLLYRLVVFCTFVNQLTFTKHPASTLVLLK